MGKPDWQWDLEPNHWIELYLTNNGLSYTGVDWSCQSGGAYMAGFQSFEQFLSDGPIQEMPEDIAAEVRARINAQEEGHRWVIRVGGEVPDEAHVTLYGQPVMLHDTATLFEGHLRAGEHHITGILKYPGVDEKGRRNMKKFDERFEVRADGELEIVNLAPRWPQWQLVEKSP